MQRVADLEPQRVARAEAGRDDPAREHRVPELHGVLGLAHQLDALLAGVAGAVDHHFDSVELAHGVGERLRLRQAEPLERARPLHGEQRVLVRRVAHLGTAELMLLQPGVRRLAIAGVDDDEVVERGQAIGDQVVDDPAALVRQQRVLGLAVGDLVEVVREQRLQQLVRARPFDLDLTHVRDVEDARVGAHGLVLRDHALVLDRHLPAGEGNHARAGGDVAVVERRAEERLHGADNTARNTARGKHEAPANRGLGPGLLNRPGSRSRGHVRWVPRAHETQTSV